MTPLTVSSARVCSELPEVPTNPTSDTRQWNHGQSVCLARSKVLQLQCITNIYKPSIQIIQAWARNSEGTSLYKWQMDHRIPQVLFPAKSGCFVSKTHSVEPGTPESGSARDHMEPMEPMEPCSFLWPFEFSLRCQLLTFLPKIVPTLCNCINYISHRIHVWYIW